MVIENASAPEFFTTASAMWDAMYADCSKATVSIEFDQYILNNDPAGQRFLILFADKASAGVRVHLLLDHIGSHSIYDSDYITNIVKAGGQVRFYNPLSRHKWLMPTKWFPRNHVKTMLIDSKIAYVGSACIREDMAAWRDTTIRLTGPDIGSVEKQFIWSRMVWWQRYAKKHEFKHRPQDETTRYTYFIHRPSTGFNPIYRDITRAVRNAKKSIRITTPYFLAPYTLRRALRNAVKRGVDVRIIMNEHSDARIADLVAQSYFPALLRRGIKIFLYQPFMLHAKCVTVDDDWASLGSSNIDYLSLHVNREANLLIKDKPSVAVLNGHFDEDLKQCIPAEKDYWKKRPFWEKLIGYAGRSIKGVL